jgi:hypothetical protein
MRAAVLLCVFILAAFAASAARADLENENLLVTAPPGYKVGFSDKKPNMLMTEFVPAKETVENWTEMVTVQVFFGPKATPQQFMDDMAKRWRAACPDAEEAHTVADAPEPDAGVAAELPEEPGYRQAGDHLVQGRSGQRQLLPRAKGVQIRAEQRADHALDGLSQKGKRLRLAHRRPRLSENRRLIFDCARA